MDSEYNYLWNFIGLLFGWFIFNNGYYTIYYMKSVFYWSLCPEEYACLVVPYMYLNLVQISIVRYLCCVYIWFGCWERYDGSFLEVPSVILDESWVFGQDGCWVEFSYGVEV